MDWKERVNQAVGSATGYEFRRVAGGQSPPARSFADMKPPARATPGRVADNHATSLLLNPVAQPEAQRTYVIFGTRRGTTSMVAGIARALGLDLGNVGKRTNNEDPTFQNQHVDEMRAAISRRNAEHDVWGWKYPAAGSYLPDLLQFLRNPYFLVVYRDPVAAALSQTRLDRPQSRRTARISLHESNANSNTNTGLVLATDRPCLLVSIERATVNPRTLIKEIAAFLAFPEPSQQLSERILEYVKPGQYKSFDDFFGA